VRLRACFASSDDSPAAHATTTLAPRARRLAAAPQPRGGGGRAARCAALGVLRGKAAVYAASAPVHAMPLRYTSTRSGAARWRLQSEKQEGPPAQRRR